MQSVCLAKGNDKNPMIHQAIAGREKSCVLEPQSQPGPSLTKPYKAWGEYTDENLQIMAMYLVIKHTNKLLKGIVFPCLDKYIFSITT